MRMRSLIEPADITSILHDRERPSAAIRFSLNFEAEQRVIDRSSRGGRYRPCPPDREKVFNTAPIQPTRKLNANTISLGLSMIRININLETENIK